MQPESQFASGQPPLDRFSEGLPAPFVPQHDGAATVLARRDGPFKIGILQRMILDTDGERASFRIEAGALGNGPAQQHALMLQAKVEMQLPRGVLLDDETRCRRGGRIPTAAARFAGAGEVTLPLVFVEGRRRRSPLPRRPIG